VQLGLERYRGVGIIGFNSPEWFISDLGAIFAGYVFAAVSIIATCLLEVSLEIQMSCTLQNVIFTWLFTWCGHTRMRWISQSDEAIRLGGTSP